jgi:uncharacterized membrane protein
MKSVKEMLTTADYINTGIKERVVSSAAGAVLIGAALRDIRHPDVKTWVELAAGAFLLFRGVSGFCPLNRALGRDTSSKGELEEGNTI